MGTFGGRARVDRKSFLGKRVDENCLLRVHN